MAQSYLRVSVLLTLMMVLVVQADQSQTQATSSGGWFSWLPSGLSHVFSSGTTGVSQSLGKPEDIKHDGGSSTSKPVGPEAKDQVTKQDRTGDLSKASSPVSSLDETTKKDVHESIIVQSTKSPTHLISPKKDDALPGTSFTNPSTHALGEHLPPKDTSKQMATSQTLPLGVASGPAHPIGANAVEAPQHETSRVKHMGANTQSREFSTEESFSSSEVNDGHGPRTAAGTKKVRCINGECETIVMKTSPHARLHNKRAEFGHSREARLGQSGGDSGMNFAQQEFQRFSRDLLSNNWAAEDPVATSVAQAERMEDTMMDPFSRQQSQLAKAARRMMTMSRHNHHANALQMLRRESSTTGHGFGGMMKPQFQESSSSESYVSSETNDGHGPQVSAVSKQESFVDDGKGPRASASAEKVHCVNGVCGKVILKQGTPEHPSKQLGERTLERAANNEIGQALAGTFLLPDQDVDSFSANGGAALSPSPFQDDPVALLSPGMYGFNDPFVPAFNMRDSVIDDNDDDEEDSDDVPQFPSDVQASPMGGLNDLLGVSAPDERRQPQDAIRFSVVPTLDMQDDNSEHAMSGSERDDDGQAAALPWDLRRY